MRGRVILILSAVVALALAVAAPAFADGVQVRFDLTDPRGGPFPADRFTVPDAGQLTGLRVNLPKPDCSVRPSDCDDIDALNALDGFNLQPRLSIPFTGAIDPATVSSETVFLFRLTCLVATCAGASRIGVNEVVWDPEANTLYAESDQLLDQDARYLLVVTNGIRDPSGERIDADQFRDVLHSGQTNTAAETAYRQALLGALDQLKAMTGMRLSQVAGASLFTTESATALLEKIHGQLAHARPAPADFALGPNGERTVFPLSDVQRIVFKRQVTTTPTFMSGDMRLDLVRIVPGAVGTIAFGRYRSPTYENDSGVIPPTATGTGAPEPVRTTDVYFNLFLPSGPEPPGGWPVVIAGHGANGNKNLANVPVRVAAKLAARGLATLAPEIVGHGGGPLGTLTVTKTDQSTITLPGGGRGVDRNPYPKGDGFIDTDEGLETAFGGPDAIVFSRDGLAQTVIDLMQLVREIEVGVDVDGDQAPDLDASRIYYFGSSLGSVYGAPLVALEPSVRAASLNVSGGTMVETRRLSRGGSMRAGLGQLLGARVPSVVNLTPPKTGEPCPDPLNPTDCSYPFNENLPLRDVAPVVNTVPGAIPIQDEMERIEWATMPSSPVAFAPHLRKAPLAGNAPGPLLYTFAKGDWVVANPVTASVLRAGDLADRATLFRYDLAYAASPNCPGAPRCIPHQFAFDLDASEPWKTYALEVQEQTATFLASDGRETVDPDGPAPLFETPIAGPLPDSLCFVPFREAESIWRTLERPCS